MNNIFIITGTNRGLGKALVDLALTKENTVVVSLSRSLNEAHKLVEADKLLDIKVDLSEPFSPGMFNAIDKYVSASSRIYFFNNAGTILPITNIGNLNGADISTSMKINVEFPVNFINLIVKKYSQNEFSIVNITTGAATKPVAYWSLYGASKAYLQMFLKVLSEENIENSNLTIYNIDPGTIDTGMQSDIRNTVFPKQEYFQSLQQTDKLIKTEDAALKIFKQVNFEL
ncbi:MAG: SDR family NAD(P)-dependent oxidoreductase [Mucilaginibacter sp.]